MYNSIIYHLFIILYVYYPKSSFFPSPSVLLYPLLPPIQPPLPPVTTTLLSVSRRRFCPYSLHLFHPASQTPAPQTAVRLPWIWVCLFSVRQCVLFMRSHVREITCYSSFSDWPTPPSIIISRSTSLLFENSQWKKHKVNSTNNNHYLDRAKIIISNLGFNF